MPNATRSNENARHATSAEAQAVLGLTKHNQDYRRLPKALQAIVDAYSDLDDADENMGEAYSIVGTPAGLGPNDAPSDQMLRELSGLVAHVRAELRRHGVIEGALAWLASHPEGWDDEPEPEEPVTPPEPVAGKCRHCGAESLETCSIKGMAHCRACDLYVSISRIAEANDAGDDPLLHGYPREWFTGDVPAR